MSSSGSLRDVNSVSSEIAVEPASAQYDLVYPPKPKPPVSEIKALHAHFYGAIASGFDAFNAKSTRGLYFNAIDGAIAEQLVAMNSSKPVSRVLSVAAGSGFREESIRRLSGLDFEITCVDISHEMCEIAARRGFDVVCSALPDAALKPESYDACVFLNGFEVLVNYSERLHYFEAIANSLRPGGLFFVDAMDIDDTNDSWAVHVKNQYEGEQLKDAGYDLGDCFCRRTDQESIVFAHYSSQSEMERLFSESSFKLRRLAHYSEETGTVCKPHEGNMFFVVEK
jgi:SAM-dependent methyltransferase